jgi:hypothetical protein
MTEQNETVEQRERKWFRDIIGAYCTKKYPGDSKVINQELIQEIIDQITEGKVSIWSSITNWFKR